MSKESIKKIKMIDDYIQNVSELSKKKETIKLDDFIKNSKLFIKILLNYTNLLYILKIYNRLHYTLLDYDDNKDYFLKIIELNHHVINILFLENTNKNIENKILYNYSKLKEFNDYIFVIQNLNKNNLKNIIEISKNEIKLFIDISLIKPQLFSSLNYNDIEKYDILKFFFYISYRFHSYLKKYDLESSEYLLNLLESLKNYTNNKNIDIIYYNSIYELLTLYEKYIYNISNELKNENIIIETNTQLDCLTCVLNFKSKLENDINKNNNFFNYFFLNIIKNIFFY